jgi:hypothetical protein
MTLNTTENKAQAPSAQDKVDTNLEQQKVATNMSQTKEETTTPQQPTTPETEGDPNWRAFREARKKDRAEREAAERRAAEKEAEIAALKAAMEAAFTAKSTPTPQAYQQYYAMNQDPGEESEDVRIEKKVNALLAKKEAENEQRRKEYEQQEYPNRLMKEFPDFNQVIAQENRDYLDYHFPEVSRPLSRLQDGYDKWFDIYHAIKKLVPNNMNARKEAARADANVAKPKSISSTGLTQAQSTPGSHILSDDRKAANWARMQQHLKGVG